MANGAMVPSAAQSVEQDTFGDSNQSGHSLTGAQSNLASTFSQDAVLCLPTQEPVPLLAHCDPAVLQT